MPDGDITVLPYWRKTTFFEEYRDDCNSSGIRMLAKPAEKHISSGSLTEKVITSR